MRIARKESHLADKMKKFRILNLYAGIGGNRKLWDELNSNIEVTAVEFDSEIAKAYKDRFPNDTVIVGCAREYLLENFRKFDFIWASPPCQTHTRLLFSQKDRYVYKPRYTDMSLYEMILFLELHSNKFKWCVENVIPYYKPLISPTVEIDRHLFWSNFKILETTTNKMYIHNDVTLKSLKDFDLGVYKNIKNKRQIIRNQVDYEVGKHILKSALNIKVIDNYINLFNYKKKGIKV